MTESSPVPRGGRGTIQVGDRALPAPLWIIGPDVIEDEGFTREIAHTLADVAQRRGISLLFKASYEKANRSRHDSFRGPGLEVGLEVLARIKEETGLPVTTDIHTEEQARRAAQVIDVLQIPAFLSRQNALLEAAASGGGTINLKKGQFLAPLDMKNVAAKVASTGNKSITLTERGNSFGYNNLVADMRSLPDMRSLGYPVVFDATHSVQRPGGGGDYTAGDGHLAPLLARAAVAAGTAHRW